MNSDNLRNVSKLFLFDNSFYDFVIEDVKLGQLAEYKSIRQIPNFNTTHLESIFTSKNGKQPNHTNIEHLISFEPHSIFIYPFSLQPAHISKLI
jgi:hypothetical protein